MKQIWDSDFDNNGQKEIEELIGAINLLDGDHRDNGFLTYWAQTAVALNDINKVKQRLYIWKRLLPPIEQKEGRKLDLFNPDDSGIVSYWSSEVEKRVDEGMSLEDAIQEVINLILQDEPTVYEELIPYIEQLLGGTFDKDNPQHMGFLTYWSQLVDEKGMDYVETLLSNMAEIKPQIEALIGKVDFLDDNYQDNGFITYWADYAIDVGLDRVKNLLSNMVQILPHLENLIGEINLLDNNYDDNGLLTFWAEYAIDNNLAKSESIIDNMVEIKPQIEALIGPINLFDHQYGDNGFLTYWADYANDVGLNRVKNLLTNMAEVKPYVEAIIGKINFFDDNYNDNGFITYWAEYAIDNGLDKAKSILDAMNQILNNDWDNNGKPEFEELIGKINFFDHHYDDNGFLTYWAEEALKDGVEEVERRLYIWKRLRPYVEEEEGRTLNLFDSKDAGILSYWSFEVEKLIAQGKPLETAIQEIIDKLSSGHSLSSFLYETSEKILYFFKDGNGIDFETGLPYSFITITKDGEIHHNFFSPEYTSISDIAMYIVSLVSLGKLGKISNEELESKVSQLITSLYSLQHYTPSEGEFKDKMYFFNYYSLPSKTIAFNKFISSMDNANLVMALITAREAFPQLADQLNDLIDKIDLSFFYDKSEHLFLGGYEYNPDDDTITASDYHYGMLNTETRLLSYLAIGKGDLSEDEAQIHWQTLGRSKKQVNGIDIVASFGGSLFEFLYPSLFLDEGALSRDGFGLNFKKAILLQKLQAIENGYPLWGESPAYNDIYEYREFGSDTGVNPYSSEGIISPYSVLLTLNALGDDFAGDEIKLMEEVFPGSINDCFGVNDAIDLDTDLKIYLKSTLVQGMSLATIANYLNNSIRGLFSQSQEAQKILPFIENEVFFTQEEINSEMDRVHQMVLDNLNIDNIRKAKVLFDYLKDLVKTYNQEQRFDDLDEIENQVNQLIEQKLTQLYQAGNEQLNNKDYKSAVKTFQMILSLNSDYQNAKNLLNQARCLRDEQVEIPDVEYLITSFEEGARPNKYVRKIGPIDGPNGKIDAGIVEDNDPKHGRVIKLKYDLEQGGGGFNGLYINTSDLNLTKDYKLVFDIKGDETIGIPEKIKIEIHPKNSSWPYPSFYLTNITSDWQHVEISLKDLLPQLPENFEIEQIAILFEESQVGNPSGVVYIDNIGFTK
jgi:hypothetical protein